MSIWIKSYRRYFGNIYIISIHYVFICCYINIIYSDVNGFRGKVGFQTSVSVIRALSLDEIEFKDTFKVIWKEIRVAALCDIVLFACNFAKLMLLDEVGLGVAGVVCIVLFITVIFARFVGCTLPILAKRICFDPEVMASPFITTIVDACSLLIYFRVAGILLGI